ncbi:MAG: conjugative transposon protein TraM [Flavobacteriales bacterium AspAUS03]
MLKSHNQDHTNSIIGFVVHQDQILVDGFNLKLCTLSDINVNAKITLKNNFIYGVASLSYECLNIEIFNIRYKNDILPFCLDVYDQDELKGIYIPGAKTIGKRGREVLHQVVDGIQPANIDEFQ